MKFDNNIYKNKILPEKKKRKREKRLRLLQKLNSEQKHIIRIRETQIKNDRKVYHRYTYKLKEYLVSKNFIQFNFDDNDTIDIPPVFSLIKNFRQSYEILASLVGMLEKAEEKYIRIDFSKCKEADFSALFPLRVLLTDFHEHCTKIQQFLQRINIKPYYVCIPSKQKKVNSYLVNSRLLYSKDTESDENFFPLHTLGFFKGDRSQTKFVENKKSIASSMVVDYVNRCLNDHQHVLKPDGINDLEGIISEILNNCEDHSPENTWYLSANFFKNTSTDSPNNVVGELNIAFLNFGFSIFEGFEETKEKNFELYEKMNAVADNILNNHNTQFERKDLITLYALQEGVSRLKYIEESRGTGTIKFINSFLEFGDYECKEKGIHPQLSIVSGSTCIICDNEFKPQLNENVYVIALNKDNTLKLPPSKTHLKTLPLSFPGTIIGVKLYINKAHLQGKLEKNEDNGN